MQGRPLLPTDPLRQPRIFVPGIPAKPWWEASAYPWVAELEAAAPAIREEMLALLKDRRTFIPYTEPDALGVGSTSGGWNVFYFSLLGERFAKAHALCPATSRALARVPRVTTNTRFSALDPGTRIEPHCGPTNVFLRGHLALVVPEKCKMRVGGEWRPWTEGKLALFDDPFEREVVHDGDATRVVSMFYVYHPELTDEEVAELEELRAELVHEEAKAWEQFVANVRQQSEAALG